MAEPLSPSEQSGNLGKGLNVGPANRQTEREQRIRQALPVFPFTEVQVQEVADALDEADHHPRDPSELARVALVALARVMRQESERNPNGYPMGYGYRMVRAVTGWFVVHPDETWEPTEGRRK